MALVVMRHGSATPLLHGQTRLRTVQCLDLALLVETQHQRLLGWIQVQSDYVGQLLDEVLIAREFERLRPVWLQTVSIPDSLHRRRTDVLSRRHRPHAPMGSIHRVAVLRRLNDLLHLFGRDLRFAPASRFFLYERSRAAGGKAIPPQDDGGTTGLQLLRNATIRLSARR